uniref:Uncharacterized protein n=1 Tax=Romanomermis culicivorax TaxID=13658 RepID=A0A915JJP3_ROMCU
MGEAHRKPTAWLARLRHAQEENRHSVDHSTPSDSSARSSVNRGTSEGGGLPLFYSHSSVI